ncbi:hypothetical protein TNCV_4811151 [Trichonephila clavipes]|nr:hypothetical protein TNCV_4811151 [Trichonephila clavipes]
MALGGSLPQINLGVQGVTQGVIKGGRLVPLITKKKRPSLLDNNKWTASSEAFPVTFFASWRSQQSRALQHPAGP